MSFYTETGEAEIPRPFHLIYKFNNGKLELVKTIVPLAEHLQEVRVIDLSKDGQKEIAIFSHAGMHYTDLLIYKYELGEYKCIFDNGSACPVELLDKAAIPLIKVGRANWDKESWCYADEPLWEVHAWDGKRFVYNRKVSSSRELSERDESIRYMNEIEKTMREINKETE